MSTGPVPESRPAPKGTFGSVRISRRGRWRVAPLVSMVLAGVGGGDADGRLVAVDLDEVEGVGRGQDPLASLDVDWVVSPFQRPGQLAFVDRPALVGEVVVPVVGVAG